MVFDALVKQTSSTVLRSGTFGSVLIFFLFFFKRCRRYMYVCPNGSPQLSNNKIKDVGELGKLAGLPNLRDILLIGNPCYEGMEKAEQRAAVLAQLPNIAKIDGEMVTAADREGGGETKE